MKTVPQWEYFEHQADVGVRGFGRTIAESFEHAAIAMCSLITDLSIIQPLQAIDIHCEETDLELLLVDWLNAIIFNIATRKMLFSRFEVKIDNDQVTARIWGENIDMQRHHPAVEIKGATYTSLAVSESNGQWIAQCVVDV